MDKDSVVRKFRTTADDGKTYNVTYYNLDMIISLGYRIKSVIATKRLKEYMIKGFTIDDERLKGNGGGNYWKELLDRIRDIRSSEKVLYCQVLDLYATSVDYNPHSEESVRFFKIVQNKLHYAAHGHTAADVLSSLQKMQDYGVNLICVEDGIDSSKDAGKLMISVLSAVAEIERENILVQTMEGHRQKAREGRWNGGFAPYGYQLVNGDLIIAEDEAEIIRIIYDKFVNTTMGMAAITAFLNNSGYKKKLRQNNTIEGFSTSFVKGVLDNPIYCGKLAFGRRKNEKIPGTRNEYHIVKQKDYLLSDGIHEAIISGEMWNQAHRKRQETGVLQVKTHSLEYEHILSGIIKCPVCGSGMYGNVNRKKHPDGGYYKDYFYYACKHRKLVDGHRCTYKRQWNEDRINAAVEEIIRKFVKNPRFEQEIRKQIGSSIDTSELDREYDGLKDRLSQTTEAKTRLADQMDHLSVSDKNYDKKYNDMQERLDKLYDEITDIENAKEEVETRLYNIRQDKISEDNVYQFLLFFDKLYDKFTDLEKKTFLKSFLSDVFIYEEEQKDGRILKGLRFKFPIYMNGRNVLGVDWDNESTYETVVLLSKGAEGPVDLCSAGPEKEDAIMQAFSHFGII